MEHDNDETASQGREKRGAPVDSAREDGREDNKQDGIERSFAREGTLVSDADNKKRGYEHDDAAQRDLEKGQVFRFDSKTEEGRERIVELLHMVVSLRAARARVNESAREARFVSLGKRVLLKPGANEMAQGDKSKYTEKQKRKAEHIEESYEERG